MLRGGLRRVLGPYFGREVGSFGVCLLFLVGKTFGHVIVGSLALGRNLKEGLWHVRCLL